MIRNRLLAATALTPLALLLPSAAQAQSAYDWSGFYAGMFAGAHNSETEITDDAESIVPSLLAILPGAQNVVTVPYGGFNVGWNAQTGMFVFGIEADAGVTHVEGTVTNDLVSTDFTLDNLLSLRARAGFAVDRTLFFATAGVAAGQSTLATSYDDPAKSTGTSQQMMVGFIGGLGVERAVTDKFSVKLEGMVYNLGSASVFASGIGPSYTATVQHAGALVRTGINVHF